MIPSNRRQLMPGEEYYIECLTRDINNNVIRNVNIEKLIGTFVFMNGEFACFANFRNVNENEEGYAVELGYLWNFYEVKKKRIQQTMEQRALDIILYNIIGDEWFKYNILTATTT